ncbi:MAG: aspartate aminotransferase family protein, partial [Candidatus Omnitrophica bacterium]|nr:aspartate aminotransferase family protein [Candidatus Omnitrophota bacterium]
MGKAFDLKPREVPKIRTKFRRIVTKIPVPESLPVLETLRKHEPISMTGQPPVVWHRANGFHVEDKWGNRWIDFSSGVLVTNAGHCCPDIQKAIIKQVESGLLHNYCFPSAQRAELAKKLVDIAPKELNKVFILTTGSEATENAIKLARTYGRKTAGNKKIGIVSFNGAFHGRTLGAQMIGGIPALKEWIVNLDPDIHQVPFPGDFRIEDKSFGLFEKTLAEKSVSPDRIAGVITETYQGGGASFAPKEYIRQLACWCKVNNVILIFDEVQAGFGRTGKLFGFEHYGVVPDMVCLGKGISSSLPISAVLGKAKIMDLYGPGEMTSTHTGNPLSCVAALANINFILKKNLVS